MLQDDRVPQGMHKFSYYCYCYVPRFTTTSVAPITVVSYSRLADLFQLLKSL